MIVKIIAQKEVMHRSLVFSVSSVEDFPLDLVVLHLNGSLTAAVEKCQQCGHPQRPGLQDDSPDEDVTNLYRNIEGVII